MLEQPLQARVNLVLRYKNYYQLFKLVYLSLVAKRIGAYAWAWYRQHLTINIIHNITKFREPYGSTLWTWLFSISFFPNNISLIDFLLLHSQIEYPY